jgi:DNA-3-methyladenine glycosylase II
LIVLQRPIVRSPRGDYFTSLCRSIIGQQVSVAAATTIFGRFVTVTNLNHQAVAAITDEQIKHISLSRQKASYLRDLAEHFVENPKLYDHLDQLGDDDIISELTAVKGIGVWTAQMFLMFTLLRLDVFAPDDGGLQRAMQKLYGWETIPGKKALELTAQQWRPYRTVACWHLWQSLDNTP